MLPKLDALIPGMVGKHNENLVVSPNTKPGRATRKPDLNTCQNLGIVLHDTKHETVERCLPPSRVINKNINKNYEE